MFDTKGIQHIATITELRTNTSEILDQVTEGKQPVLIQRNGEPRAVMVPLAEYEQLVSGTEMGAEERRETAEEVSG